MSKPIYEGNVVAAWKTGTQGTDRPTANKTKAVTDPIYINTMALVEGYGVTTNAETKKALKAVGLLQETLQPTAEWEAKNHNAGLGTLRQKAERDRIVQVVAGARKGTDFDTLLSAMDDSEIVAAEAKGKTLEALRQATVKATLVARQELSRAIAKDQKLADSKQKVWASVVPYGDRISEKTTLGDAQVMADNSKAYILLIAESEGLRSGALGNNEAVAKMVRKAITLVVDLHAMDRPDAYPTVEVIKRQIMSDTPEAPADAQTQRAAASAARREADAKLEDFYLTDAQRAAKKQKAEETEAEAEQVKVSA